MKTAEELRREIVALATNDDEFRSHLLQDAKGAIEGKFGVSIPDNCTVEVHEDTSTSAHVIVPPSGRLGEAELASVAGGWNMWDEMND